MKEDFWDVDRCYEVVSDERINYVEETIGVKFPKSYRELVKRCDGGYPVKDEFDYYDEDFEEVLPGSIGGFLNLGESPYGHVLKLFYSPPEFFPEGLIAFTDNGGGDFVCFDYRQGKDNLDPPIVYWSHEADEGKDISFIAPNFDAFIKMLYRSEYED